MADTATTAPAAPPAQTAPSDNGFPAGTPIDQMTVDQQAAYWKHQARKHEGRVKAFGDLTPEQLQELREKADRQEALEHELASDADKREREARKQAAAEADAKYLPRLAETAFRVAIGDSKTDEEIDDFLGDLNLSRFITEDGQVDTAKVRARVQQFLPPATGTPSTVRPGPSSSGQGTRPRVAMKPGEAGLAAARKRGFIPAD